ncbi:MAG: LysR family transcriptional regulator, partial [Pseudomonadota bacterium]
MQSSAGDKWPDGLPPLNGLRAFEAVARHLSITGAAQELHVTQSAVSHQVRNLERTLGVSLLNRFGPRLELTVEGRSLCEELSGGFAQIKRGVGKLMMARDANGIGVLVRPHFAMNWLSPRIPAFSKLHPDLNLHFYHANAAADFNDPNIHASIEWRHRSTVNSDMVMLLAGELTPACQPGLLEQCPLDEPRDLAQH